MPSIWSSNAFHNVFRRSEPGRRRRPGRGTTAQDPPWLNRLESRTLLAADPIISEILASNSGGLADQDGDHPDWIELYNPSTESINLGGWSLTDDPESPDKWHFPAVTLDPSGFLVVFASNKNRATAGAELHTNFALGASGDYLAIVRPDGTVADEFTPAYPQQASNVSYGVAFDSATLIARGAQASVMVPTDGSLEGAWDLPTFTPDGSWINGPTGVGYGILQSGFNVRYVQANVEVGSLARAELVLATSSLQARVVNTSADTINYFGTGSSGNFSGDRPFPTQTFGVDIDNFVIDARGLVTIPTAGAWSFGVNSDDGFRLTLERNGRVFTTAYEGPRGPSDSIQVFDVPEPGQWNIRLEYFEQGGGSHAELFAAPGARSSFDGGVFRLVGDSGNGGLAVGSVLVDSPGSTALVGRFVADDLNGLSDGAAVGAWTDRDPDQNGAILAAAAGSPTLAKGVLNGHSTILFDPGDGPDQLRILAAANPLVGAGDFSAAVVFRTATSGLGAASDWWANSGLIDTEQPGEVDDWGMGFNSLGQVGAGIGKPDVSVYSQTGLADGRAHLAVIVRSAGRLSIYVDGRLEEEREDVSILPRNVADLVFGSLQTNQNYFTGEIAEVRLYNSGLTASELQRLATEMDATYNLPGVTPAAVGTDVRGVMQGVNSTTYVRIPFEVLDLSLFDSLSLRMGFDDGFVAYLNGVEVARSNAPGVLTYNSTATAARAGDPRVAATFNLTASLGLLHPGTNLLAIRGLNVAAADDDFLVLPELIGSRVYTDQLRFFATPTPGTPNVDPFLGLVAQPTASVSRGFFEAPFTVALSVATAGAEIRYTLDGSEPTATNGVIYTGPLTVSGTTTLRIGAFRSGYLSSPSITHTYLFVADVINQSPDGSPPAGWPTGWGGNRVDYGMDPDIVNSPLYGPQLIAALRAIPTLSLTTDLGNLFDPTTGIYANAYQQGREWERPASLELINPDGSAGFQIDAGVRIRGGYSRSGDNAKHSFRFFFRGEYGASSLDFPLFGAEGASSFDKVDLRTAQNYSWSYEGNPDNNFIADVFSRDTMRDMGQPYTRSRFYQLYIDGQYWGLYQTEERPDADYAASYLGGTADDYDVIKVESGPYTTQATDGNFDAWNRLYQGVTGPEVNLASNADYYGLQGKFADGSDNPEQEVLLDVDNLIDYMITIFYGGNLDAPISAFLGNGSPNNFFAIRNRTGRSGFIFIQHDAEHTLLNVNEDRTGPFPAGQNLPQFNPQYLHQQLMANANYRLRFADHVQKAFFNGGALTVEAARARFQSEATQIRLAIIAESARWGDARRPNSPLTQADWQNAVSRVLDGYMPYRSDIVLAQFRAKGLYPTIVAPTFAINGVIGHGGQIRFGDIISLNAPAGVIFYTTDGSDPRLPDGSLNRSALAYAPDSPIILTQTTTLTARVLQGGAWSAVDSARFAINVPAAAGNLAVTEFDYRPSSPDTSKGELDVDRDLFEFVELRNIGDQEISLNGVRFTSGISFDFTGSAITSLAPGAFVLIVKNPAAFISRYGAGLPVAGTYGNAAGGLASLSNSGERLLLVDATGRIIEEFTYASSAPWPTAATSGGRSLVRVDPLGNPNDPTNWRASLAINGSPGNPDTSLPTLSSIADATIDENTTTGDLAFTIGDAETPIASLRLVASADNLLLLPPGSVTIGGSGANRTLRITPARDRTGSAAITLSLTDADGATTRMTFRLIVTPVDDLPAFAPVADRVVAEGNALDFVVAAADPDSPEVTIRYSLDPGSPAGAAIDPATGRFRWTPSEAQGPGVYVISVRATTSGTPPQTAVLTFTITVNETNVAPVLADLPDRTVVAATTLIFFATATDADLPSQTLSYTLDPGAPAGAIIDVNQGLFIWRPEQSQPAGVYEITVRVTDNGPLGLSDAKTFRVAVTEPNRPPVVVDPGDRVVAARSLLTVPILASDPDRPSQILVYSLDPGAPVGATIDPSTGIFSWTPGDDQGPNSYTITVRVTDYGSPTLSGVTSFLVTVNKDGVLPSMPTFPILPNLSVAEGSTASLVVAGIGIDVPSPLIYTLAPGAPQGATLDPTTGQFSWTPDESQGPGVFAVTVLASSAGEVLESRTFRISVAEVNRPPVLAAIADAAISGGGTFRAVASATDPDVPANSLTYRLDPGAPAGATVDTTTGAISWSPSAAQGPGTYTFTVRVSDDGGPGLSAARSFVVTVTGYPPPSIDLGSPAGLRAGQRLGQVGRFVAAGPGPYGGFVDYGDGSGVQGLALAADGSFVLDHVYATPGYYAAVVSILDGAGGMGVGGVGVSVGAPPLVTITPGLVTRGQQGTTAIRLILSDAINAAGVTDRSVFRLISPGRDGKFGTRDDRVVRLKPSTLNLAGNMITITTRGRLPITNRAFRLQVSAGSLRDTAGRPLDGDRDGLPGGTFFASLRRRTLTAIGATASSRTLRVALPERNRH